MWDAVIQTEYQQQVKNWWHQEIQDQLLNFESALKPTTLCHFNDTM